MSPSVAAAGFLVLLVSGAVTQSQNQWGVSYSSHQICALKGSTVEIRCTFRYPPRINGEVTKVDKSLWFTRKEGAESVELKTDVAYTGRVQYHCGINDCTLRISELRQSDSAEYKFMFITNQFTKFTGSPGVNLSVTDLQVQVGTSADKRTVLRCWSSCRLACDPPFSWYKNGRHISGWTSQTYSGSADPADSFSCAVRGYERFPSPPVYAPRLPSVSVSPSAEIVEGSSVNLTCSSDANPAASYTWFKDDEDSPRASGPIFTITDLRVEHSGNYYCEAWNRRGRQNSTLHLTVKAGKNKVPSLYPDTTIMNIIRLCLVVVMLILLLLLSRSMRKKKSPSSTTEPADPAEIELDDYPAYENISAAKIEDSEEQEEQEEQEELV